MPTKNITGIRQEALKKLNMAFGVMTVIPLLICLYLVTVKFFSIDILVGLNGIYFLVAIAVALMGLIGGRNVILGVVGQLSDTTEELEKTLVEEAALNERLKEEIAQRVRAQESLKLAQDRLIQAAKMESVGQLAAGAAHEIKNPLAMLNMGIDFLKKSKGEESEKADYMLSQMDEAIKRADRVTRDLLDYSSLSELELKQEDLNSIVELSLSFVKHDVDKYGIEIVKDFGSKTLPVHVDRNRMQQVFVNLFTNAIHAMTDGGELTIRTSIIQLERIEGPVGRRAEDRFKPGDKAAIIQVEDTGAGIPQEDLVRVFDPFFTTKRNKGGTGLGLAVIRNIVDMHKGSIDIHNKEDHGTSVTILLKA